MAHVAQVVLACARVDGFDRNFARELRMLAAIDDAHPPAPDALLDSIAADDGLSRH
jgi:hypothetical protein